MFTSSVLFASKKLSARNPSHTIKTTLLAGASIGLGQDLIPWRTVDLKYISDIAIKQITCTKIPQSTQTIAFDEPDKFSIIHSRNSVPETQLFKKPNWLRKTIKSQIYD